MNRRFKSTWKNKVLSHCIHSLYGKVLVMLQRKVLMVMRPDFGSVKTRRIRKPIKIMKKYLMRTKETFI